MSSSNQITSIVEKSTVRNIGGNINNHFNQLKSKWNPIIDKLGKIK